MNRYILVRNRKIECVGPRELVRSPLLLDLKTGEVYER